MARLEELATQEWTRDDTVERMRGLYQFRRRRLKARAGYLADDGSQDRSLAYQRLVRELLQAQRREIVLLRNQGEISNEVMHRIEHGSGRPEDLELLVDVCDKISPGVQWPFKWPPGMTTICALGRPAPSTAR